GCSVGPCGFKEPQRGIHGVELSLIAGVDKAIGQHALVSMASKVAQNATGYAGSTGKERESGERNHGVTPPVSKPRIAGNHGPIIAPARQVLIRRDCQRAEKRIVHRRRRGQFFPFERLGLADGRGLLYVARLGRSDDPGATAFAQLPGEHERVEQIFLAVQPSFLLLAIEKVSVPVTLFVESSIVVRKVKSRQARIGLHTRSVVRSLNPRIEAVVLMRGGVIIAKGNQRPYFQHGLASYG